MLTINEAHEYHKDGVRIPGYSEICKDLGVTEANGFYTDDGRDQGTALHAWLLFLAQGNTPAADPEPEIAGRVEGIKKFLAESRFVFSGGEVPQFEPTYRYACTPDLWGHMGAFSVVIDAKRGAKLKSHALQTAAQKMALTANGFMAQRRYSLYLRDGDYRLEPHEDKQDEARWKAIVSAYHAKQHYRGE